MILIVIQIRSKLNAVIDHLGAVLTNLAGKTYTTTNNNTYNNSHSWNSLYVA